MSSDGDSGLSAPISVKGNDIITKIISKSKILHELNIHGTIIRKSVLIRAATVYLLENLDMLADNPALLQRVYSNVSFTHTLSQIKSKIPEAAQCHTKSSDRVISISTQIHNDSHRLICGIIAESKILRDLEKQGYPTAKSIVIKAALAYLLENLDILEKRPEIIHRILSLSGTHYVLEKIHSLAVTGAQK